MIDTESAFIGWRLAQKGDEEDVADWAYEHVTDLLVEIVNLQHEQRKLVTLLRDVHSATAHTENDLWDLVHATIEHAPV